MKFLVFKGLLFVASNLWNNQPGTRDQFMGQTQDLDRESKTYVKSNNKEQKICIGMS